MESAQPANDLRPLDVSAPTEARGIEPSLGDVRRILSLIDEVGDTGWWIKDLRRGRLTVSTGFGRLTGLQTSGDLTWADIAALVHPQDRHILADLRTRMTIQRSASCQLQMLAPDGSFHPVTMSCRTFSGSQGMPSRTLGLIRLLERRDREPGPEGRSVQRLANLVKSIAAAVWTVRPDGHVKVVPEWLALTGQSAREAEGLGWLDAIHPEDRARVDAAWRTAVEHQTPYNTNYRLHCADGTYRWFTVRGVPVLTPSGSVEEWLGVCIEIPGNSRFRTFDTPDPHELTPAQVRGGRAMLNWSVEELGRASGVSPTTIRRLEKDERANVPRADNLAAIRRALEGAGLEFTYDPDRAPGVRPVVS